MNSMKAAILGAGFIASFHAAGYLAAEGAELCAVCDTDEARARELAQRYGCAYYTDAKKLLDEQMPQLVSVCLPTHLHREYVVMALRAGAHVLCEKPFALTMEDCIAMEQAAQEAGRLLMVGQVLRWWPEYTVIAENIRRLGTPQHLCARRLQHPSRPGSWHMYRDLGGGALFDLFVHDLDFLLSLMGTDAEVVAANGSRGGGDSWRRVSAMLRWPCGTYAEVEASSQMPAGYPFTAEFSARYPDAALDYRFRSAVNIGPGEKSTASLTLYEGGGVHALPLAQNAQQKAFDAQIQAFVCGAGSGISPLPASESVAVMQVVHAVRALLEQQAQRAD